MLASLEFRTTQSELSTSACEMLVVNSSKCFSNIPVESYFDEIYIDGESAYFTTSCDQVTGSVLQEVQEAFISMLRSKGTNTSMSKNKTAFRGKCISSQL